MFKFDFDSDGFKRQINDHLEKHKGEIATEFLKNNLSDVKCPVHGESPKNVSWRDGTLHFDECCEELVKAVNLKIEELQRDK